MSIHKLIELENLPKHKDAKCRGIDWEKSIGSMIYFEYDDIKGYLKIVDFKRPNKLKVQYVDKIYDITCDTLHYVKLGRILGKRTKKFKMNIDEPLKDDKRDMIITDREYRKGKKYYKYKCNKCGYDEGWTSEYELLRGNGCSCCAGRTVVPGINDIATTDPWMVKYFQGGSEEASKYTKGSGRKICPICPDCGRVKIKPIKINKIYTYHSIGCVCNKGISYPEKFMYNLLTQLGIKFIMHVTKNDLEWCKSYEYDFYLIDYNTIIETHGMQHYEECTRGRSLFEEQENDKNKKEKALMNRINKYIELDCRYSSLEHIKRSILNSELNDMFNLSSIDWVEINEFASGNFIKQVCEYYESHKNHMLKDICENLNISFSTFNKYLKKGNELGWCTYIPKDNYTGKHSYKKVKLIETNEIFESIQKCSEIMTNRYKVKINSNNISRVCLGYQNTHKGFHFEYVE